MVWLANLWTALLSLLFILRGVSSESEGRNGNGLSSIRLLRDVPAPEGRKGLANVSVRREAGTTSPP